MIGMLSITIEKLVGERKRTRGVRVQIIYNFDDVYQYKEH